MSQAVNETFGDYSPHSGSYEDEQQLPYEEAAPFVNTSALGAGGGEYSVHIASAERLTGGSSLYVDAEIEETSEKTIRNSATLGHDDSTIKRVEDNVTNVVSYSEHPAVIEFDQRSQSLLTKLNGIMAKKQCTAEELNTVKTVLEVLGSQRKALLRELQEKQRTGHIVLRELRIDTSIPHDDNRVVNASPPAFASHEQKTIVKPLEVRSNTGSSIISSSSVSKPVARTATNSAKPPQPPSQKLITNKLPVKVAKTKPPLSTKSCPPNLPFRNAATSPTDSTSTRDTDRRLSQISISSSGVRKPLSSPSAFSNNGSTKSKISNFSTGGVVLSEKNLKNQDKLLQKQKKPWVSNFAQTPSLVNGLFGLPPSVNQFRVRAAARKALQQFSSKHGQAALCEDRGRLFEYLHGSRVMVTGMDERVNRRKRRLQKQQKQIREAAESTHQNHGIHEWWFEVPEEGTTSIRCVCGGMIEKQTVAVWQLLLSLIGSKPQQVIFSRNCFQFALAMLPLFALHLHLSRDSSVESGMQFFASFCWCHKHSVVAHVSSKLCIPATLQPQEEKRTVARPSISGSVMQIDQLVPTDPPRNIHVAITLTNDQITLNSIPSAWSTTVIQERHSPSVSLTRSMSRPVAQTLLSHILHTHTEMLLLISGEAVKRGTVSKDTSAKADLSKRTDHFIQCLKCGIVSGKSKASTVSTSQPAPHKPVSRALLDLVENSNSYWDESLLHAFLCDVKSIKMACHTLMKSLCSAWDIESSRVFHATCVCEGKWKLRNKNNTVYCHLNCGIGSDCSKRAVVNEFQRTSCSLETPQEEKTSSCVDYIVEEVKMSRPGLKVKNNRDGNNGTHPFTDVQILSARIPAHGVHPSSGLPTGNLPLVPPARFQRFGDSNSDRKNISVSVNVRTNNGVSRKSPEEIIPLQRTTTKSQLFSPSIGIRGDVHGRIEARPVYQDQSTEQQAELHCMHEEEDPIGYSDERLRYYFNNDEKQPEQLNNNDENTYIAPPSPSLTEKARVVAPILDESDNLLRIDQIYPAYGGNNDQNAVRQSIQKQMLNALQHGGAVNVQDPRFLPLAANRNYQREGYLVGSSSLQNQYEHGEDSDILERHGQYPSANDVHEPVYHNRRAGDHHIRTLSSATSPPSFYNYNRDLKY